VGLPPQVTYPKGPGGINWSVLRFAPDGRRVYATGLETRTNSRGLPSYHRLGLRVIDLEHASTLAEALAGERIDWLVPAPDGSALYVYGPRQPDAPVLSPTSAYVLRRLDAVTLKVTAERDVGAARQLFFLAAAAR
jgi:hypothetical protein